MNIPVNERIKYLMHNSPYTSRLMNLNRDRLYRAQGVLRGLSVSVDGNGKIWVSEGAAIYKGIICDIKVAQEVGPAPSMPFFVYIAYEDDNPESAVEIGMCSPPLLKSTYIVISECDSVGKWIPAPRIGVEKLKDMYIGGFVARTTKTAYGGQTDFISSYPLRSDGKNFMFYVEGLKQVVGKDIVVTNAKTISKISGNWAPATKLDLEIFEDIERQENIVATSGQKVFNLSFPIPLNSRRLMVFQNGKKLVYQTQYTESENATTGNGIVTLVSSATTNDVLEFVLLSDIVANQVKVITGPTSEISLSTASRNCGVWKDGVKLIFNRDYREPDQFTILLNVPADTPNVFDILIYPEKGFGNNLLLTDAFCGWASLVGNNEENFNLNGLALKIKVDNAAGENFQTILFGPGADDMTADEVSTFINSHAVGVYARAVNKKVGIRSVGVLWDAFIEIGSSAQGSTANSVLGFNVAGEKSEVKDTIKTVFDHVQNTSLHSGGEFPMDVALTIPGSYVREFTTSDGTAINVSHMLGVDPSVTLIIGGEKANPQAVEYLNKNQLVVHLGAPNVGKILCIGGAVGDTGIGWNVPDADTLDGAHLSDVYTTALDNARADIEPKIAAMGALKVGLTGNETIAGTKTFSSIPLLPSTNPTNANHATRKAYVDNEIVSKTASIPATYEGGESLKLANGLIMKFGYKSKEQIPASTRTTITFADPFPNGVVNVSVTQATVYTYTACDWGIENVTKSSFVIYPGGSPMAIYWMAIGW